MQIRLTCPFYFILFLLLTNNCLLASTPQSDLFKKYKEAVVKIEIRMHGIVQGTGAGFFLSPDGDLATNYSNSA